ncbi:hypothetical protein FRC0261_00100 [Corynebacterium diphtheriae]|nr:hypothetical protein FRC0261_00100 [Corynebacterium diphtheriae]CAB0936401.1 hypothetical protein FRC0477_00165 [Corynebacterium diphtheriae]
MPEYYAIAVNTVALLSFSCWNALFQQLDLTIKVAGVGVRVSTAEVPVGNLKKCYLYNNVIIFVGDAHGVMRLDVLFVLHIRCGNCAGLSTCVFCRQ